MQNEFFITLKQSLEQEPTPELFENLVDELQVFFQVTKVKLLSNDPELAKDAAKDMSELKNLLLKHPMVLQRLKS